MGTINIKRRYHDAMFWIRINDGDEFAVRPNLWNNPEQRESIIAAETGPEPQPWMGEIE
ncbi:hypothetical protein [Mycobacterium intracellulare]|uniref:Uncharacterized protein n=1 Tax=Mycobacterium intracellulare 1956 TaxID=1299331 RepID=X8CWJ7_MYCIT|nr:hypothetical protein [Mycobacterium intracellulare]EUA27794.1 hypothetical protein I548_5903 [Mycobacterium intracellulare]EUA59813.1 hypothetical protein I550_2961 [Mycobacterium intracellulare 1956]UQB90485.1 hypothetical protein KN252_14355 [Mycobacterium intracellulare]